MGYTPQMAILVKPLVSRFEINLFSSKSTSVDLYRSEKGTYNDIAISVISVGYCGIMIVGS